MRKIQQIQMMGVKTHLHFPSLLTREKGSTEVFFAEPSFYMWSTSPAPLAVAETQLLDGHTAEVVSSYFSAPLREKSGLVFSPPSQQPASSSNGTV